MTRISPEAVRQIARLKIGLTAVSIIAVLAVSAAVVTYMRFSTLRPLVTVGNRTISKREYLAVLDQRAGKQVLDNLVFGELVRQAATKAHVMPSSKDVDTRLALIQANDRTFDQAVAAAGGLDQFRQGVQTDLALDNLRTQGIPATDAEVTRFYSTNQALFRHQAHAQIALIAADSMTDAQAAAHLLTQGVAPEVIARQPGFHLVGQGGYALKATSAQQRQLLASLRTMKAGDVKAMTVGSQSLAVKVTTLLPAQTPTLAQVRDQVTRLVKLQKAPTAAAELAMLYKAHKPDFAVDKYADYFSDVEKYNTTQPSKKVASLP